MHRTMDGELVFGILTAEQALLKWSSCLFCPAPYRPGFVQIEPKNQVGTILDNSIKTPNSFLVSFLVLLTEKMKNLEEDILPRYFRQDSVR